MREVKLSRVEGKRKSEGESIASRLLEPRDRTEAKVETRDQAGSCAVEAAVSPYMP